MRRQRKADELRSPAKKKTLLDLDDDATPGGLPDAMDAVTCLFNANGGLDPGLCVGTYVRLRRYLRRSWRP